MTQPPAQDPAGWGVVLYRHTDGSVPAEEFLDACPMRVAAKILAVISAVRDAPPPAFSGGGMWEAMRATMAGFYEVRVQGPGRMHYRLFCLLDSGDERHLTALGLTGPRIALIDGGVKKNAALFEDAYYRDVKRKGDLYRITTPRPIAT